MYARLKGLAPAVKAGEYEIQPGTTPRELLTKMVNGEVLLHSFTIVDGWRVQDLLDALRRNSDIAATLPPAANSPAHSATVMAKLGSPGTDAEGQFLPETYRFIGGTPDIEVLRQAHAALVHELDADWANRDPDVPLHSSYELLIMASIVEKESGLPQELPKIAGLYLHRLAIGMRLQADPTVIYGLAERYDGTIHTVDLQTDGPYNTYTRVGLPPTPIALGRRGGDPRDRAPGKNRCPVFCGLDQGRRQSRVFSDARAAQCGRRGLCRTSAQGGAGIRAMSALGRL